MNEFYQDFQYDSCSSRGICTTNPKVASLQSVLVQYLKLTAKYALALAGSENTKNKQEEVKIKELILNTIPLAVSNPEFTETSFILAVSKFKEILPGIVKKYNKLYEQEDFKKGIRSTDLFQESSDIIQAIRFGEKSLRNILKDLPPQIRDLYQIMLVISKSISINLLDLESMGKDSNKSYNMILKLLDEINSEIKDKDSLKSLIYKASKIDNELMMQLRTVQEERYGTQGTSDVSYSTTPSKAALVVGSNIRELETILEALKKTDIDVYTHDDMMVAHTFPKFSEYKNLKGQYGQGLENCLLDFSTFPGPIILTKHSLHNIENLYRGRLFTTDYTVPKGVIKIENNDYSSVIESAENAKGFKTGKQCETVTIGYNFNETINLIKERVSNYKRIFMIGLERYSLEQKAYFEKLIKLSDNDTLIISFSYNTEKENVIHINTCFDSFGLIKVYNEIKNTSLPITVFIPKCDRNTISQMIYLSEDKNTKVFVGKCTPIILNPSLIATLKQVFEISGITTAKKDLETIT